MEGSHPIQGLMQTAMESMKMMVDVNTILGDPVETPDGRRNCTCQPRQLLGSRPVAVSFKPKRENLAMVRESFPSGEAAARAWL